MGPPEARAFADAFARLVERRAQPDDVEAAFAAILAGAWNDVQIGAYVASLRLLGDDPEVLVAAARALRAQMTRVEHGLPLVVDTCGTGGDGAHTLNLSTAAALVVASLGVPVAKHGNRAVSSRSGSADVLEALGLPLDVPAAAQAAVLRDVGVAFLMAPVHHPALRHAAKARRELGVRTLFNALGPLANPAGATHQVVGVYSDELQRSAARALASLGVARAWVVRGEDGLDEISPVGPTRVLEVAPGRITELTVTPEDFGAAPSALADVAGGDAAHNAAAMRRILEGAPHPAARAVALSAAAALVVARGDAPTRAYDAARACLATGAPATLLASWVERARAARSEPAR
ncbi:MAG: anthranilate phosphoribosyltransferase [Myxococcales bacterium]|nr:anthranilate phosphoribosyltransferase [Myxococcales bacterium]